MRVDLAVHANFVREISCARSFGDLTSPDHPITRSPDHPITRSPDHPITRSPDSVRALRNADHNLPNLGIGFEILVRLHRFRKGEYLGDLGTEASVCQAVVYILLGHCELLRIERDLHQHIAAKA